MARTLPVASIKYFSETVKGTSECLDEHAPLSLLRREIGSVRSFIKHSIQKEHAPNLCHETTILFKYIGLTRIIETVRIRPSRTNHDSSSTCGECDRDAETIPYILIACSKFLLFDPRAACPDENIPASKVTRSCRSSNKSIPVCRECDLSSKSIACRAINGSKFLLKGPSIARSDK